MFIFSKLLYQMGDIVDNSFYAVRFFNQTKNKHAGKAEPIIRHKRPPFWWQKTPNYHANKYYQ